MAIRMQQRRGTAAQWTAANPVLGAGEVGFETDTTMFKIGDGVNAWSSLGYFASKLTVQGLIDGSATTLQNSINSHVTTLENSISSNFSTLETGISTAVTSHAGTTTNIHGIDNTANLATKNYADGAVSTHAAVTTNVHGIADTSALATKTYADGAVSTHNSATTSVHGIANTANLATKTYADGAVSTHNSATTSVHGIADTSALATKTYADAIGTTATNALALKAPIASPTFTGTVSGITKSMVGLGNVDNTADTAKPVSTAQQTALDLKANLAGPTFTGTVVLPSTTSIGTTTATELGYVHNVTSAIQTQLDSKLALAGGTMTGALTLSGAPTSDLHAATKAYVDAAVNNVNIHESVVAATTANITLATAVDNGKTLDGVTLATGNRILVKNQTIASANGIYIVAASGAPTRATDYDAAGEVSSGDFIFVSGGTVNGNTGWIQTAAVTTVGTDSLSFTQFSGAGTYTAGTGLTLSGTSFSIGTGAITSGMILDGTIVDADINASAAIAQSKISGLSTSLGLKANLASPSFTGGVTVDSSGIIFTDGTQTKEGVPSRTPIVQKTASYTLSALSERDSLIEISSTSATTLTVPANSAVAYPVGTSIDILQTNTGQITVAGAAGVTVNATPGLKLRTQWSGATLFKRATDTWVLYGDLSA